MLDFEPNEVAKELAAIWSIQQEIHTQAAIKGAQWLEERLRELLEKLKNIAPRLRASGMTVQVGFPVGASVSLSWELSSSSKP